MERGKDPAVLTTAAPSMTATAVPARRLRHAPVAALSTVTSPLAAAAAHRASAGSR